MNQNYVKQVNTWLKEFDTRLSLDGNHFCPLRMIDLEFGLQLTRDGSGMFLHADITPVATGDESLLRRALTANYFQQNTRGGYLAVNEQRNMLELQHWLLLQELTVDTFANALQNFALGALSVKNDLRTRKTSASRPQAAPRQNRLGMPIAGFA